MTEPVTTIFSWEVEPGKEAVFTDWLHNITGAAVKWPGHMGVTTLRPPDGQGVYYSVLRFDTQNHMDAWLNSDERKEWIDRLDDIATPMRGPRATGLETWFDFPGSTGAPARWKMVVVTFVAVYPFSLILGTFVTPFLSEWNPFVRALIFPLVIPIVLTYFVMPWLTQKVFKSWLYK